MLTQVRITGFGGQGVITAGYILGRAVTIYDEQNSIFTMSYGPEARGSACSSQILVSDNPILYPFLDRQDILCAMSQEGFDKFIGESQGGATVLYDPDLIDKGKVSSKIKLFQIPVTKLAEDQFNKRIVANIIMLGHLATTTGVVSEEAILKAVSAVAPGGTQKLNEEALKIGFEYKHPKSA